jgi:hypothetical protein
MNNVRHWSKLLLWLHLFVCVVWLLLFHLVRTEQDPPIWMLHIVIWSILGIQFTWGFTVGLRVGPSRKRRDLLWWSLLTIFMPIWFFSHVAVALIFLQGLLIGLIYLAFFVVILACETFGGVLLGARIHSEQLGD